MESPQYVFAIVNYEQASKHSLNNYFNNNCLTEYKKITYSINNQQEKNLVEIRAIQRIKLGWQNGKGPGVNIGSHGQERLLQNRAWQALSHMLCQRNSYCPDGLAAAQNEETRVIKHRVLVLALK